MSIPNDLSGACAAPEDCNERGGPQYLLKEKPVWETAWDTCKHCNTTEVAKKGCENILNEGIAMSTGNGSEAVLDAAPPRMHPHMLVHTKCGIRLTTHTRQVNVPKTRRTYCKGKDCKKHTQHKVTQYKAGKVREYQHMILSLQALTLAPGLPIRTRKAPIRPQAVRLRWSDETRVPQEGKDDEEGCVAVRMHVVQDQGAVGAQALQAL